MQSVLMAVNLNGSCNKKQTELDLQNYVKFHGTTAVENCQDKVDSIIQPPEGICCKNH